MSAYKRKPPPLLARCAMGLVIDGFMRPFIRVMAKLGRADRVFERIGQRRNKQLAGQNPFGGYVPGEHDVFVAAYVKSGTNWTMQIAHQLLTHGRGEFAHIHEVIPWPDIKTMGAPLRNYAVPLEDESAWRASPERKRVIKTHLHWEDLPYSESARYICVIRDPKDVLVSSYHFFGTLIPLPSLDLWIRLFCSENMLFGSWATCAAGYWAQRHRPNVLLLSFKSMKRDLSGTVRKMADFLGLRADEDIIQRVVERSTFEHMKRIDHKFDTWRMIPWRSKVPLIRKGAQGGSSELLSPQQQREMDAYFLSELKRLGSDLPYEEFADVTLPLAAAQ